MRLLQKNPVLIALAFIIPAAQPVGWCWRRTIPYVISTSYPPSTHQWMAMVGWAGSWLQWQLTQTIPAQHHPTKLAITSLDCSGLYYPPSQWQLFEVLLQECLGLFPWLHAPHIQRDHKIYVFLFELTVRTTKKIFDCSGLLYPHSPAIDRVGLSIPVAKRSGTTQWGKLAIDLAMALVFRPQPSTDRRSPTISPSPYPLPY